MIRACCYLFATLALGATEVPYGHPDFHPSSERPIGWRGDGTGSWPGARIVADWDASTGRHIVWRTAMPGAGMAQPIVVGEKVFTTADPNLLLCLDVHSGKILWQAAVDHTSAMPAAQAAAAREEIAFFADAWLAYGEWLEAGAALQRAIAAKGFDGKALWWDIKAGHLIHEALNHAEQRAKQEAFLADPELAAEFRRLRGICLSNGFVRQKGCNGTKILTGGQLPDPLRSPACKGLALDQSVGTRLRENRLRFDLWGFDNWEGYTTWSFATPCSDGEAIYVTTVNNAVACYDLMGKQRWLVWDHPEGNRDGNVLHTRFVPSPFLAGDRLVVNQNGELRAFDKRDGRKRWSVVNPYAKNPDDRNRSCRPTPEGCSPAWARLPLGQGQLDVVVDAGGKIYRLDDGVVVGEGLPRMGKGASPICQGDLYIWKSGADNRPSRIGVVRMVAENRDRVRCETLWAVESACKGSRTNILHDGRVFYSPDRQRGAIAFDLLSGAETVLGEAIGGSSCSPIIAGDRLVSLSCGSFGGEDGGTMGGATLSLGEGTVSRVPRGFVDDSLAGDSAFARRNRHVGCGDMISNGSPSAQANRLFFRTKGYLWCIGDPAMAFPVPADCPQASRVR